MSALDSQPAAVENSARTSGATFQRGLETLYLLIFVVMVALALVLLPGLVRSNQLPLPVLNNLANPVRVEGFYPTESNGRDVFRWTSDKALIYLPETLTPEKLIIEVAAAYPDGTLPPRLHLRYAGQEFANQQITRNWTRFEAKFPSGLNMATGPLELVVENPLPPHQGDNRLLGVAIKAVDLEVSRIAPLGITLTTLALGVILLLVGRWLGFGRGRALTVALGPVLLITLYWQLERFYGAVIVGCLALAAGLVTLVALYPRTFFPPAPAKSRWRQFNGGFIDDFVVVGPYAYPEGQAQEIAPTSNRRGQSRGIASTLAQRYCVLLSLIPPLLIVGFVFVVYGKALDYGFFWDDYHIARPWSLGEVAGTFAGSWDSLGLEPAYFRPLTVVSFAMDGTLWGYTPSGYHLTNLLLFSLAAALLYFLIRKLGLNWFAALVGAFLFVILPPNVAAAEWISERSDSLAAIFMLAGLLAFSAFGQAAKPKWLIIANLFLVLALCSKEIAVVLPLLYLAWGLAPGVRGQRSGVRDWKKWLVAVGPSFLILGLYLGWRILVLPASAPDPDKPANLEALWNGYHSATYQSFYGLNNLMTENAAPWFTLALLLLLGVGLAARPETAGWRSFFFGLGWLLLSCAPLAFLGASYSVTTRVLFLPEAGYAILGAALVGLLLQFASYAQGGWRFWPTLALLAFLVIAPYTPLNTANQRAQKDYAPTSFNTLRWDEWIYNRPDWKAKIPEQHFKTIEQKLRDAGRIR